MSRPPIGAYALALCALSTGAVEAASDDDQPDHPLISRPANSTVHYYEVKDFDSAVVVLNPIDDEKTPQGVRTLDGQVFRAEYQLPKNTSLRQAQVSYQRALSKAGFRLVLDCRPVETCGSGMEDTVDDRVLPSDVNELSEKDAEFVQVHQGTYQGKETYVLLVGTLLSDSYIYQQIVTVDDAASIVTATTVASAKDLAVQLGVSGAATVAGIYFDTDKSIVKPESRPALEQVAAFLKQNPKTRLYIVGHTDGSGDYAHNQALAEARAKAVRDYLSQQLKIEASRMEPHGVGPLAPVASNRAEEGRSANRRVMIVEKP